jgi:hypothetical protein
MLPAAGQRKMSYVDSDVEILVRTFIVIELGEALGGKLPNEKADDRKRRNTTSHPETDVRALPRT